MCLQISPFSMDVSHTGLEPTLVSLFTRLPQERSFLQIRSHAAGPRHEPFWGNTVQPITTSHPVLFRFPYNHLNYLIYLWSLSVSPHYNIIFVMGRSAPTPVLGPFPALQTDTCSWFHSVNQDASLRLPQVGGKAWKGLPACTFLGQPVCLLHTHHLAQRPAEDLWHLALGPATHLRAQEFSTHSQHSVNTSNEGRPHSLGFDPGSLPSSQGCITWWLRPGMVWLDCLDLPLTLRPRHITYPLCLSFSNCKMQIIIKVLPW